MGVVAGDFCLRLTLLVVCALLPCVFSCVFFHQCVCVCAFVRKRPVVGSCSFVSLWSVRCWHSQMQWTSWREVWIGRPEVTKQIRRTTSWWCGGSWDSPKSRFFLQEILRFSNGFSVGSSHCFDWSRGREDQVGSAIIVLLMTSGDGLVKQGS